MRKKIAIVILTWNRAKFLKICLEEMFKNLYYVDETQVIVMDNGSTDETPGVLKAFENRPNFKIVRNEKNEGLNAYKKLFSMAKAKYVVDLDDDVLQFPKHFDKTFVEYMKAFPDYGFLALDVIQNEFTDGAKPELSLYKEDTRGDKTILMGPTGGWCSCFRKWHFNLIKFFFMRRTLGFNSGEDGVLHFLFAKYLRLKAGIIKGVFCFHACGPYYSKQYGYLDRDIEKYKANDLANYVEKYSSYK